MRPSRTFRLTTWILWLGLGWSSAGCAMSEADQQLVIRGLHESPVLRANSFSVGDEVRFGVSPNPFEVVGRRLGLTRSTVSFDLVYDGEATKVRCTVLKQDTPDYPEIIFSVYECRTGLIAEQRPARWPEDVEILPFEGIVLPDPSVNNLVKTKTILSTRRLKN